jgi:hypothetical protein
VNALTLLRQTDEPELDTTTPAPFIERRDPANTCDVHLLRRDSVGRCTGCTLRRGR